MRLAPLALPLLLCAGCGDNAAAPPPPPKTAKAAPKPPPAHPEPTGAEAKALAASSNGLAMDLYGKLRSTPGNLAFSPASISMALAMTWGGARGETAAQMGRVLHLPADPQPVIDAAGKQLWTWNHPTHSGFTLTVANRLFGEKTYSFEPAFLKTTEATFDAPLEPTDFRGQAEPSRAHINDWVSEQTKTHIQNLLPAGSLTDQTRLVLVNAIYLLATWVLPFDKEQTRPESFTGADGTSKAVPTMHQTDYFAYGATDGVKVLEMSYEGTGLAMTLVLPDAKDGLPAVEARLSEAQLSTWIAATSNQRVAISLPSFEVNPAEPVQLSKALADLGMPLAFDRDQADFTGIANPPNPADRLCISAVFHKAFVKVDEAGTEAAAATGVVMMRAGAAPPSGPPAEFKADHPFLFFLRDPGSGMILFAGRVVAL